MYARYTGMAILGNNRFTEPSRREVSATVRAWPRAMVFDCDGLLIDSAACWEAAYRAVARSTDVRLDRRHLAALAGASVASASGLLERMLAASIEENVLRDALAHAFETRDIFALPGADDLLAALSPTLPLAVATNGPLDLIERALERIGLRRYLQTVVSAESVARHKPQPDVYLEACRRLRVDPSDAIAFEDSPTGLAAARAAGLITVGVPPDGLRLAADLVFPSLDDPALLKLLNLMGTVRRRSTGA